MVYTKIYLRIFIHLKLAIASAMPASNEWKIKKFNSADLTLAVREYCIAARLRISSML